MISEFIKRMRLHNTWCTVMTIVFLAIVPCSHCSDKKATANSMMMVAVTSDNCDSCGRIDDAIDYINAHHPEIAVKKLSIHNPQGAMFVSNYRLWRVPVYLFLDGDGSELYRLEGEQQRSDIEEAVKIAVLHQQKKHE